MKINAFVMVLTATPFHPIVGQAVNRILMEGQDLGQRRQKTCQSREKNRKCYGCRTNAVFWLCDSNLGLNFFTWKLQKLVKSLPPEC